MKGILPFRGGILPFQRAAACQVFEIPRHGSTIHGWKIEHKDAAVALRLSPRLGEKAVFAIVDFRESPENSQGRLLIPSASVSRKKAPSLERDARLRVRALVLAVTSLARVLL